MAIDLTRPAEEVTTDAASPYRPLLEKLQGNILKSHGRNVERHLFLRFTGEPAAVRARIRDTVAPQILTAAKQFDDAARRHVQPGFDGGMATLFFLSGDGYRYLGLDPRAFESKIFRKGMKDEEDSILDDFLSKGNKDPKPDRWEAGYRGEIHALLQLGDDDAEETRLLNGTSLIRSQLQGIAQIVAEETGRALRRTVHHDGKATEEPIEHFGYFDGISQPLFTKADLDDYYATGKGTTPGAEWDPSASLDLVLVRDALADDDDCYGSFLVYRKLHQDVGAWDAAVAACAAAVGTGEELAGAMAVGRFKDGTPVVDSDTPTRKYTNDFFFDTKDPKGSFCPMHAHIRKANPRGTTPATGVAKEKKHRIVRRGIPYGKPMPDICDAVQTDPNPHADRGLLFLCFQANIARQFAFIQRTWCDNPNFPSNVLNLPGRRDTGDDPLIGQDPNEPQHWPNKWGDEAAGTTKHNFDAAVTLKGGEYFFAPSLPFLKGL